MWTFHLRATWTPISAPYGPPISATLGPPISAPYGPPISATLGPPISAPCGPPISATHHRPPPPSAINSPHPMPSSTPKLTTSAISAPGSTWALCAANTIPFLLACCVHTREQSSSALFIERPP
ncbi:hypothetical protein BS78_K064000 [Paspalum vaginatum]|uniref:Uncharacterized protein n=1 Tax=Paspalum vaginatum TaxID=158149 RepID=A0A9W7XA43_9POAL|nr:hypothetical protein BS78_K064000 [Paspalum vaginatum]